MCTCINKTNQNVMVVSRELKLIEITVKSMFSNKDIHVQFVTTCYRPLNSTSMLHLHGTLHAVSVDHFYILAIL